MVFSSINCSSRISSKYQINAIIMRIILDEGSIDENGHGNSENVTLIRLWFVTAYECRRHTTRCAVYFEQRRSEL